ncbi:hypothetical protein BKA65DRAFT_548075 [Rhexocercosporidium sp. MPI-PUGE-AT-0058]|nr:hypothetical protein BKA65DRAFT_548075 [Rhexocercosporidium sp. MPI-PUGE-AT-0058]
MGAQRHSPVKVLMIPPADTHPYRRVEGKTCGKHPRKTTGKYPRKTISVKRDPDTSNYGSASDDTGDDGAESGDMETDKVEGKQEIQPTDHRATSRTTNYFEARAARIPNTHIEQRRSGRNRRPTEKLFDSILSRNSYKDVESDGEEREDENTEFHNIEEFKTEEGEIMDYTVEDESVKPIPKLFMVESGYYDLSRRRPVDETLSYQIRDIYCGIDVADNEASKILKGLMAKSEWRGDYTVVSNSRVLFIVFISFNIQSRIARLTYMCTDS